MEGIIHSKSEKALDIFEKNKVLRKENAELRKEIDALNIKITELNYQLRKTKAITNRLRKERNKAVTAWMKDMRILGATEASAEAKTTLIIIGISALILLGVIFVILVGMDWASLQGWLETRRARIVEVR